MKKFLFSLFALSIFALSVNATDLFTDSKHVSWDDGGLRIEKEQFADAKAGDKIVVTFTGATDGIEFKVMNTSFDRLPGSLAFKEISDAGSVEQFLTPSAVAQLKQYGLEIIGANFTVTRVELAEGKDNVTDNTVWTGFFWMDSWSTLEITYKSFVGVAWNKVKAIRFYSEADNTGYVINVRINWDNNGVVATNTLTKQDGYAELILTDEMKDILKSLDGTDNKHDRLMVQCNKEVGAAFNFTAIELVMKETSVSFSADLGQGNYVTTFSADYATKVPNGVTAYTAKVDGPVLKLTEIADGVVPANEGVLLRSNTNGEVNIPYVLSFKENDVNNLFVGTSDTNWEESNKVKDKTVYVLARNKEIDQIGFIQLGNGTVPANKAVLAADSSLGARSFSISFDDSELTSVQGISENSTVESAVRHNVLGQCVAADAKGIVIVNGKKVLNN